MDILKKCFLLGCGIREEKFWSYFFLAKRFNRNFLEKRNRVTCLADMFFDFFVQINRVEGFRDKIVHPRKENIFVNTGL